MRLDLNCSYQKVYHWDAESLTEGKTFGRSNQFKKRRLSKLNVKSISSETIRSNSDISTSNLYEFQPLALSQKLLHGDIKWVPIKKCKFHFINTQIKDFVCPSFKNTTLIKGSKGLTMDDFPLLAILSSLLINEVFLDSLKSTTPDLDIYLPSPSPRELICMSARTNVHTDTPEPEPEAQSTQIMATNYTMKDTIYQSGMRRDFSKVLKNNFIFGNYDLSTNKYYSKLTSLRSSDQSLLLYFIENVCPNSVCYSRSQKSTFNLSPVYFHKMLNQSKYINQNPFLYLIVPLALESNVVLNTVLSTSALHLGISGDDRYKNIAETYSACAIRQLPGLIEEKQFTDSKNWDDVLATVLMLCFKELSTNVHCKSRWGVYLGYARYFVKKINSINGCSLLGEFFARYFITNEVIGNTASIDHRAEVCDDLDLRREMINEYIVNTAGTVSDHKMFIESILNEGMDGDLHLKTLRDRDTRINIFFGCAPYLICLVHQISSLAECCEGLELEEEHIRRSFDGNLLLLRARIVFDIGHIDQRLEIQEGNADRYETIVTCIAEIKRLTNLLYLFVRVDLELYYLNGKVKTKEFVERTREMEATKAKVKQLYDTLPEIGMALLWPLFILGIISANYEDDRWFVLNAFEVMEKMKSTPSLVTSRDAIISIWKSVDLGLVPFRWQDMMKDKVETLSLALIN